jgi:hypothetical protein
VAYCPDNLPGGHVFRPDMFRLDLDGIIARLPLVLILDDFAMHLRAARVPVGEQLDQIEHQDTSPRHQRPSIRQSTNAERTF